MAVLGTGILNNYRIEKVCLQEYAPKTLSLLVLESEIRDPRPQSPHIPPQSKGGFRGVSGWIFLTSDFRKTVSTAVFSRFATSQTIGRFTRPLKNSLSSNSQGMQT